jgi:hypothetical protein
MADSAEPPDLLKAGILSYIEALIAVRGFRREIQSIAREVVQRRMPELMDSIGFERGQVRPEEYTYPEKLEGWDGSTAWVTIRLRHLSFDGHFGWLWRHDGEQPRPGVVAMFALNPTSALF